MKLIISKIELRKNRRKFVKSPPPPKKKKKKKERGRKKGRRREIKDSWKDTHSVSINETKRNILEDL